MAGQAENASTFAQSLLDCAEITPGQRRGCIGGLGGIAQQIRGMKARHHIPAIPAEPLPPELGHAAFDAQQALHSSGTQQDDHPGIHLIDLMIQPGSASG